MSGNETISAVVPTSMAGERLDVALSRLFDDYSRARIQRWIAQGSVHIDARAARSAERVTGGERVTVVVSNDDEEAPWQAEQLALNIVFEDDDILVIDKPAGLVVHPGAGNPAGTLVNGLLGYDSGLAALPRAGIVHRLDKDTSGLLVVARSLRAHKRLVEQLREHRVRRQYQAIVHGVGVGSGTIDVPIGRHPVLRTRMSVRDGGKPAVTHYRAIRRFDAHSHVALELETGRTHQIRVHLTHLGHPIVGDATYTRKRVAALPANSPPLGRQALHAAGLSLCHPVSANPLTWESPLPTDMRDVLDHLASPQ